jgi:CubicO group peptidase (beta-lactamase class C family)
MRRQRSQSAYVVGCIIALTPFISLTPVAHLTAQTPVALQLGGSQSHTLSPGDTLNLTVSSPPRGLVRGTVEQMSANVAVLIRDPNGAVLQRVDLRDRGLEPFQFESAGGGEYRVQIVSLPDNADPGEIRVRLTRLEPLADDPAALAEQLLSGFDGPDSPGAAIRVWRDGQTVYSRTFGMANLTHGVPFTEQTPTNIGSTSKQFTALAVMLFVEEGRVSLEDDIRDHLPELPDFGEPVRVRHLLSHASGYREIYNLMPLAGRRSDLGDHIDRAEIVQVVQNQPALQNAPGAEWNYNNTAYGLAALLVERLSGRSFTQFMQEQVFAPLGMENSVARAHAAAIVPGRSEGYQPDRAGGWREARDLGGAIGAGAVYASIEDLEIWAHNYANPRVGRPETLREMMTPFVTTAGDTTTYGLGLRMDEHRGLRRISHGGADVAHRSQLALYPEIQAGITVQGNSSVFDSGLAFRLAEAFFGDAMAPAVEVEPTPPAQRERWQPSPEALNAFVGRYLSDEIQSFYEITLENGDLVLAHRRRDPVRLVPDVLDEFLAGSLRVAFERDRHGAVTGFYLDNQRTRDVRFARIR